MQETQVQSLGWEDPLEKGMYSGLETNTTNFIDRGAWQATVHGVTKSQIQVTQTHCAQFGWKMPFPFCVKKMY